MNSSSSSMPAVKSQPSQQRAEDYLNSILPPKEYTEKGKLWVRYVSPTPATKVDVLNLKIMLDKRLDSGCARDVGICPIRETLFQQCFDEVIRQITINCAERGFLLVRVRDELRSQLNAYQGLYDSSIAYGMRHALMAEQKKSEIHQKINQLTSDCEKLEDLVDKLGQDQVDIKKLDEDERAQIEEEHQKFKAEMGQKIFEIKDEIDTVLSNPNFIA